MRKLIPISEAAKLLGVHADTLRRWEREGKIKPRRTSGNLRRYDIADIRPDLIHAAPTASRAARRRHHRRSPWRPEAGLRAKRRGKRGFLTEHLWWRIGRPQALTPTVGPCGV